MSAKNIDDQNFDDQASDAVDSSFDESYEDDATYSEDDSSGDWSEDGDDAGVTDEEAPAPQKKKSSTLTVIIILVVAIVGVLGFMVVKGGGAPAPEEQAQEQTPIDADAESTPAPDAAVAPDATTPAADAAATPEAAPVAAPDANAVPAQPQQGLMDNPDVLNQPPVAAPSAQPTLTTPQAAVDATAPVMDAPVDMAAAPDVPAVVPDTADTKTGADVVDTISPNVKPVSDFPSVDSIKKPDADMAAEPAPVVADAVSDTAQADKVAEVQAQLNAAQGKIADLEKSLSDKQDELDAQKSKAAEIASDAPNDAEIDALKSKIADLEDKLAAKAEEKSVVVERTSMADEGDVATEPKPAKKVVVATAKAPKPVKNLWVLKSASSSKAILSDKSTGDLKTVGVGDVVPALGRIISITNTNSSWVVKGTTGSVSE